MKTLDLSTLSDANHPDQVKARMQLSSISQHLVKSGKIVFVTGAGISCSCGIPDFRSSDGLYNLVKERYPNAVVKGKDLFDSILFNDPDSTKVFFTFMAELKRSIDDANPSATHKFIRLCDTKNKMLRSYTQNIDGMEARVGVRCSSKEEDGWKKKETKNIQLHGDLQKVRCSKCNSTFKYSEEYTQITREGEAPECPACVEKSIARVAREQRELSSGFLRPAIVLYDEPHPYGDAIADFQTYDINRSPDMLIVMGTSLKVHGIKSLVKDFAREVHGRAKPGKVIFVNKTPLAGSEWEDVFDFWVKAESDEFVKKVEEDWRHIKPADFQIQKTLSSSILGIKNHDGVVQRKKAAGKAVEKKKSTTSTSSTAAKTATTTTTTTTTTTKKKLTTQTPLDVMVLPAASSHGLSSVKSKPRKTTISLTSSLSSVSSTSSVRQTHKSSASSVALKSAEELIMEIIGDDAENIPPPKRSNNQLPTPSPSPERSKRGSIAATTTNNTKAPTSPSKLKQLYQNQLGGKTVRELPPTWSLPSPIKSQNSTTAQIDIFIDGAIANGVSGRTTRASQRSAGRA